MPYSMFLYDCWLLNILLETHKIFKVYKLEYNALLNRTKQEETYLLIYFYLILSIIIAFIAITFFLQDFKTLLFTWRGFFGFGECFFGSVLVWLVCLVVVVGLCWSFLIENCPKKTLDNITEVIQNVAYALQLHCTEDNSV